MEAEDVTEAGGVTDLAEELGDLLTGLNLLLRQATLPPGMSLAACATMATLDDRGPQRVTDLARIQRVTQPTMSALVNAMERQGWVGRTVGDADRRTVMVCLAPAGKDILAAAVATRARLLERLLASLPVADREALAAALPALHRLIAEAANASEVLTARQ